MKHTLFLIAEFTVIVFYAGMVFAIAQGLVNSIVRHYQLRHIRRLQHQLAKDLGITGAKQDLRCTECKAEGRIDCKGHTSQATVPVKEMELNHARVAGKDIDGIHNPRIMKRAGLKPVPKKK